MIKPVKFVKELIRFVSEIYEKRNLIYELVKRDFKNRYTGSYLGLLWTFLQPLMMMLIMWFVFTFGFKGRQSWGYGRPFCGLHVYCTDYLELLL